MKLKPRKNCIVCGEKIHRGSTKGTHQLRRGKQSITCSKPCSRIYTRISVYIKNKLRWKKINKHKRLKTYKK